MITETQHFFSITYRLCVASIACNLCSGFGLLVERSEVGQKIARERCTLHLRSAHGSRNALEPGPVISKGAGCW